MQTKTLNTIVFTVSQVLNLLIILYFAVLLAKLVWWVINPTLGDVYIEKSSATEFEKSAKYISNRNPFGIITKPMESATVVPTIASQTTLSGVYFGPPKSMAFITYNNNPLVVKVGGSIAGNATIKEIFVDHIIVSQNGAEANVNMDADPDNSYAPDSTQDDQPAPEPTRKSNASMNNSKRNTTPNISATKNNNDLQERRRKLISNFAQKTANPTDNNANSQTPGSNQEPIPGSVPGAIPGAINTNNRMNGNENNNNNFNNENKNHNNQENNNNSFNNENKNRNNQENNNNNPNNNNLNNNQENNRSLNNNSNGSNANQNNS